MVSLFTNLQLGPVLRRDYFLDFYIWCPLAGAPKPLVDLRVTGEQMAALVGKVTASQCQLYRGQSDTDRNLPCKMI